MQRIPGRILPNLLSAREPVTDQNGLGRSRSYRGQENPFAESLGRLLGAITTLLAAGAAAGVMRADVQAGDVLASLSGVSLTAGEPAQREQASRMLDLLMDGLRYHA